MGEKKRTHAIFGEFIDSYTIKESEADGATVPVLYEGRTGRGAIKDGVQELQSNRNIWSPHKRAAQDELSGQLFDHLMRLRPPLFDIERAGVLADRLMEQARANHENLLRV
jgi:type I site-specific restriction-modification system R (restriction) subunit